MRLPGFFCRDGLGFPTALIYPLAIAKVLGLVAIWTNKSRLLKELAYGGFAIDFIMASIAHGVAGDGVDTIIWLATENGGSGNFYRDRIAIPW